MILPPSNHGYFIEDEHQHNENHNENKNKNKNKIRVKIRTIATEIIKNMVILTQIK